MPDRIYIELEREEAERLDDVCEAGLSEDTVETPAPPALKSARTKLRAALASQESGEGRCGGSGGIVKEANYEPRERYTIPCPGCPDCQPQSGEGEDWPGEIMLETNEGKHAGPQFAYRSAVRSTPYYAGQKLRRYIPAPEGSGG